MGRFPVRLEKAMSCLQAASDGLGLVRDPTTCLYAIGLADASTLVKRLVRKGKLEVQETTDSGRIALLKILGQNPDSRTALSPSETHAESCSPIHESDHALSCVTERVKSVEWKKGSTRFLQALLLLKTKAEESGTPGFVKNPLDVLFANGFRYPAPILKVLDSTGCIEVIRGGGANGRRAEEAKILKDTIDAKVTTEETETKNVIASLKSHVLKKHSVVVEKTLPESMSIEKPAESAHDFLDVDRCEPRRIRATNRTLMLVDLENILIGMEHEGVIFDASKFRNIYNNYGTPTGLRCFVAEKTYHRAESVVSEIIKYIPVTVVADGKDAVDCAILEEARTALKHDFADIFLICTRDGGWAYQALITEAKRRGKVVKILAITKGLSRNLVSAAGQEHCISISQHDPRESELRQCVRELCGAKNALIHHSDKRFVQSIVRVLNQQMRNDHPPSFMHMYTVVWNNLPPEVKGAYRQIDCKYVLESLASVAKLIVYRKETGAERNTRKFYYLDRSHRLFRNFL